MSQLPDLNYLSDAEKDALIRALWQRLDASERRIAELEAKLGEPPKTPDNSSVPPSKGQKANQPERPNGKARAMAVSVAEGAAGRWSVIRMRR